MTQKGESNHFNVKYLSGYGFSIKVKDSMIELKDNGDPFSEPTIERHFVKHMPYEKIVVSGKGFISTEALTLLSENYRNVILLDQYGKPTTFLNSIQRFQVNRDWNLYFIFRFQLCVFATIVICFIIMLTGV